jgi:hypothetical protein
MQPEARDDVRPGVHSVVAQHLCVVPCQKCVETDPAYRERGGGDPSTTRRDLLADAPPMTAGPGKALFRRG